MSGLSITLENPPEWLGVRKFRRMYKASMGESLKTHRQKTMPYHFTQDAFNRYNAAYKDHYLARRAAQSQVRRKQNKNKVDEKFKQMHDRGNRAGILIFRRILEGELVSDEELAVVVHGGNSKTSIRKRNELNKKHANLKRGSKRQPLVSSGLLKNMALNNPAKIVGTPELTSLSIRGPFFLNLNPTNFNKRIALTAINNSEESDLLSDFDRRMQRELDQHYK